MEVKVNPDIVELEFNPFYYFLCSNFTILFVSRSSDWITDFRALYFLLCRILSLRLSK